MNWIQALKIWNNKRNKGMWCVAKKGTEEYNEVMAIMRGEEPIKVEEVKKEEPIKVEDKYKKFKTNILREALYYYFDDNKMKFRNRNKVSRDGLIKFIKDYKIPYETLEKYYNKQYDIYAPSEKYAMEIRRKYYNDDENNDNMERYKKLNKIMKEDVDFLIKKKYGEFLGLKELFINNYFNSKDNRGTHYEGIIKGDEFTSKQTETLGIKPELSYNIKYKNDM